MSFNIEEEYERDKEIGLKYTKEYDAEFAKTHFTESPCNIWGYIQDLELRIKVLEDAKKG